MPERREEVTTEGGLDLRRPNPRLRETIRRLDEAGARVSLFIDPDLAALDAAKDLGVPAVELHTGRYAHTLARRATPRSTSSGAPRATPPTWDSSCTPATGSPTRT